MGVRCRIIYGPEPDTLVVEFLPISGPDLAFLESVKLWERTYALLMLGSLDD
jgi:hypothetical protein